MLQADVHQRSRPGEGVRFALSPQIFSQEVFGMSLIDRLTLMCLRLMNRRAELDEKALLIALFVLAAVVGLSPLGQRIAAKFQQMASQLGS